mgnify:CR=1 FL=1
MSETNFIDPNKKTKYGQDGVQIWIGTVVGFDSQKEQIESGWGWRYKVRIDGDHAAGSDLIEDEELSYATCLLPTTAGSGAAYKLRSVRISQGDQVFGIRGGGQGAPTMILGVLPRTKYTKNSSGAFGVLSGFWGNGTLSDTEILSGQFNDQVGPEFLKGASGLEPGEWTKATAEDPSEKTKEIVPQVKKGEIITDDDTKQTDVKEKVGKVNENWKPGDNLNTKTMDYLKESFEKGELSAEDYKAALKQAEEQGLDGFEKYVIEEEINKVKEEEVKKENKKEKKIYIVPGTNVRFDNRDKAVRWILNHIETKRKPQYEKSVNSDGGLDSNIKSRYEKWLFIIFKPYVEMVQADQQSITSDELRRIDKIYSDFNKINPYATP